MNNKLLQFLAAFTFGFLAFAFPVVKAQAVSLQFSPTSAVVVQNNTVTLTLSVNVDTNNVQTSDVTIRYVAGDLDFVSATNGGFFSNFSSSYDPPNNLLELKAWMPSSNSNTGSGNYATVVFKAKKSSGSSTVSIDCTNTHIYTISPAQNVLSSCASQTNSVSLTYSNGTAPTPTPTVGPGTPTPTPTPGQGGGGNNTVPTCVTLTSNTSVATGTPLAVTFTCSGIDPDGYINAAEFTFGDGSIDTVYKNAGSPGSISTTHTYTTIGSLGALCRVRDNNNIYSGFSNDCKRIIVINPKPTDTLASSYYTRVIGQDVGNVTPTPEVVALVTETPAPTLAPTLALVPTKNPLENLIWWIIGALIAILAAVLLLRKKKSSPPPFIEQPPVPPPA